MSTLITKDSRTPLHIAANRGKLEICDYLLQNRTIGALIDVSDKKGQTPLMHDVKSYKTKVVKMLVSADDSMINNMDEAGWTVLHFAASNGCLEITKIFKTWHNIRDH
ncbi:hypothetical protein F2Q68_00011410 [Brassica cretica]|uniref:PGG domain-containing protein n=1 Tax=Brassica cretica TaxID=69181 RepID=A0A8S9KSD3_BRACR|nr:hypothetical protein F2Q68_00011410 [Brassica cretica]